MEPVVGIFQSRSAATQAAASLRSRGFRPENVQLLLPEPGATELPSVPTDEAEQPGVGQAVGGVIGAAAGASAGLGLGATVASLLVPGIGAVTAVGIATAALFGAGGAVGGAAIGHAVEEKSRRGLPRDEIYLYEDALSHGRSLVFVLPDTEEQSEEARRLLESAGAESLDAARERWWVGLRDAESAHYEKAGGDFTSQEDAYRRGYVAALHPELSGMTFDAARPTLHDRFGDEVDTDAFRRGYERGARRARARAADPASAARSG
jgi:hypothetical protein